MVDDISRSWKLDALDLQRQCKVRSGWSSCCDFWGVDIRGPIYLDPGRTRPVFPYNAALSGRGTRTWSLDKWSGGTRGTELAPFEYSTRYSIDWWFPPLPSSSDSSKEIDVSRHSAVQSFANLLRLNRLTSNRVNPPQGGYFHLVYRDAKIYILFVYSSGQTDSSVIFLRNSLKRSGYSTSSLFIHLE